MLRMNVEFFFFLVWAYPPPPPSPATKMPWQYLSGKKKLYTRLKVYVQYIYNTIK